MASQRLFLFSKFKYFFSELILSLVAVCLISTTSSASWTTRRSWWLSLNCCPTSNVPGGSRRRGQLLRFSHRHHRCCDYCAATQPQGSPLCGRGPLCTPSASWCSGLFKLVVIQKYGKLKCRRSAVISLSALPTSSVVLMQGFSGANKKFYKNWSFNNSK